MPVLTWFPSSVLMAALLALPVSDWLGLNRVTSANAAAARAQTAYQQGEYVAAVRAYDALAARQPLTEAARLNLAQSLFRAGSRNRARTTYAGLSTSLIPARRAVALNQLALLAAAEENPDRALDLLRRALRANPRSATIRTNYETLLRAEAGTNAASPVPRLGRRPPPRAGKQPQSQAAEDAPDGSANRPQGQGNTPGGGDRDTPDADRSLDRARGTQPGEQRGESPEADARRPDAPGTRAGQGQTTANPTQDNRFQTLRAPTPPAELPLEKAQALLDAMRAVEEQYLQQLPAPTRKKGTDGKPDW